MRFSHILAACDFVRGVLAPHESLRVRVTAEWAHPANTPGFVRDSGVPPASIADWRLPLSDGSGIHAKEEAPGVLDMHWDRHDPTGSLADRILHGALDAPMVLVAVSTGIGALIGAVNGGADGAKAGAISGLGISALLAVLANLDPAAPTAQG